MKDSERSSGASRVVIAKPQHQYCSWLALLLQQIAWRDFPPGASGIGGTVSTMGQESVRFVWLYVTVLIKVSPLSVDTHTQYKHTPQALRNFIILPKGVTVSVWACGTHCSLLCYPNQSFCQISLSNSLIGLYTCPQHFTQQQSLAHTLLTHACLTPLVLEIWLVLRF